MGLSILVVDDEEMICLSLSMLLSVKGYEVSTALDTATALEMIEASVPDVVISDMLMPGRLGLDAIQAIRSLNPNVKIIAMSGGGRLGNRDVLTIAGEMGADACLEPFVAEDLLRLL